MTGATRSTVAYADATDANREDNIYVFDIRAEKQLTFTPRVRLRLMFDAFNLGNSHASETIGRATGLSYQRPTLILAPRTARAGLPVSLLIRTGACIPDGKEFPDGNAPSDGIQFPDRIE